MADQIPIKVIRTGGDTTALQEFTPTDTVPVNQGGTGALDAANARANLGAADATTVSNHIGNTSNPHGTTAAQVGAIPVGEKGNALGVAELDATGKVPVAQLPAAAIPNVFVVADATARNALTVQEGDEAIQLDDGSHWIFDGTIWQERPSQIGLFQLLQLIDTSGNKSMGSGAFTPIPNVVLPAFTPFAGEVVLITLSMMVQINTSDRFYVDIEHNNSGSYQRVSPFDRGIQYQEAGANGGSHEFPISFAIPISLPNSVPTTFRAVLAESGGSVNVIAGNNWSPVILSALRLSL